MRATASNEVPQPETRDDRAPEVSVLIVTYNAARLLDSCIGGVKEALRDLRYEVIIVDNASTDGTHMLLINRHDVRLVRSCVNLGFAGGNRLAASMARGDTLLLLNADTVASQDLSPLIRLANAPLVGSAGCRLRYRDGRIQPSFGYSHSPIATLLTWCGMGRVKGIPRSLRRLETRSQEYLLDHDDVGWVSGACMATRREVWDRIGGLDERYFMYCEDVDYCLKVSDAGLRVAYTASTEVVHLEAGGEPWVGRVALLHTLRSYQVFFGDRSTELGLRLLFFGLAALFIARSFAARLLSIAGWRSASCAAMNASKAAAYCEAASAALRVATLGREPFGFD